MISLSDIYIVGEILFTYVYLKQNFFMVQDCNIFIVKTQEIPQSFTKRWIYIIKYIIHYNFLQSTVYNLWLCGA